MMSRKKKVLIIIQLCFAFSYLSWLVIQPYVKEVVTRKSEAALFEAVMEREANFQELSPVEQKTLLDGYEKTQARASPSFLHEIGRLFFVDSPGFALAWLFFSIVICLLLLFQIEGASHATWLLPLLVLGYAYFLYAPPNAERESLFPSEEYVVANYVEEPKSGLFDRREMLLHGWHNYLVAEWAEEVPSREVADFGEQLEKGLFAFNVARLKWIMSGKGDEIVVAGFTTPPSFMRVACYFIWNLFFAWFINRRSKSEAVSNPSFSA